MAGQQAAQPNEEDVMLLPVNSVLKDRYRIEHHLAKGAFGQICVARDLQTNEWLAVKVESLAAPLTLLRMEVSVLREMQNKTDRVPRFYGCGHTATVNYVLMELLGPSLLELKKRTPEDRFSLQTAVRIADQMAMALECLHQAGFVHRDVKPANFAVGRRDEQVRLVHMLDFGLCRQMVDPASGKLRPPRMKCGFRGTVRYASIASLKGRDIAAEGDLWSLYYVLVEMINGQLPWRRVEDKRQVLEQKENGHPSQLLLPNAPTELTAMVTHLQTLDYYSTPDYTLLRGLFDSILKSLNITADTPMDWEKSGNVKCSSHRRLHQETAKSQASDDNEQPNNDAGDQQSP